ncbi:MAG: hypothetical protein AB1796_02980 [Bacillota bacterium]
MFTTDRLSKQASGYENRLKDIFYRHRHLPPELITRAISKDFTHFHGTPHVNDDITETNRTDPRR